MNSYATTLPNTGLAVSVLGYTVGGAEMMLAAVALVATGATMIRFSWRRDRPVSGR